MNGIANSREADQLILAHEGKFPFGVLLGLELDSRFNGKKGIFEYMSVL